MAKAAQAAPPDPFSDPTHGYDVFRPWHLKPAPCPGTCSGVVDGAGQPINLQTWYEQQRAAHPDLVKKVVYGKSRYGQDLVAYKISLNANTLSDGAKPVVWYETTQHAREWIATEAGRLRLHVRAQGHAHVAQEPSPTRTATTCSPARTASTPTATGRRGGATTRRAPPTSSTTTLTAASRPSPSPRSRRSTR